MSGVRHAKDAVGENKPARDALPERFKALGREDYLARDGADVFPDFVRPRRASVRTLNVDAAGGVGEFGGFFKRHTVREGQR